MESADGTLRTSDSAGPNARRDLAASLVVFLVALPLCMGVAIASGVPVAAGLVTGIIGGLVVGTLAGCPLAVSGPTAGQAVVVFELVQRYGPEMLGPIVLLVGLMQLAAGLLRLGAWGRAVSPAVVQGMLAGMGILILAGQFHVMVDDAPKGSGLQNLLTIPAAVRKASVVPSFGDPEERQVRRDLLRSVGELHRRQARIREGVLEILPDHATPGEWSAESPETIDREQAAVAAWDAEQRAVHADLVAVGRILHSNGGAGDEDWGSAALRDRLQRALDVTGAAVEATEAGRIRELPQLQTDAVASFEALLAGLKNHDFAAHLGLLTIAAIVGWQAFVPRKLKFVPSPLVAVGLATVVAGVFYLPVTYVEVPDNFLDDLHLPTWDVLRDAPWGALLQSAGIVAGIACSETLLCCTAVDRLHSGPRTNYDRELLAQGTGNFLCGLCGALPMAAVVVRSAANVQAGATSRRSSILHGLWMLLFVGALGSFLRVIPTSSLAAVLVFAGWKLVDFKALRRLAGFGRGEVIVHLVTMTTIVVFDLLTGVVVGIVVAGVKLLLSLSRLKTRRIDEAPDRTRLVLEGRATFLMLPRLSDALDQLPRGREVHIDIEHLDFLDHACLDALSNWSRQYALDGGTVVLDWDGLHRRGSSATSPVASRAGVDVAAASDAAPGTAPPPDSDGQRDTRTDEVRGSATHESAA